MDEEIALELISRYLGDIISHVVEEFDYGVDLEDEYDDVLYFIYRRLVRIWFNNREPSPRELEATLRRVRRRHKTKLINLVSYLVSRYAKYKGILRISHHGSKSDPFYLG